MVSFHQFGELVAGNVASATTVKPHVSIPLKLCEYRSISIYQYISISVYRYINISVNQSELQASAVLRLA